MTHTLTLGWARNSETIAGTINSAVTGEANVDPVVPATTVNQAVVIAVTIADVADVFVMSDQDVTLLTNSTGSPAETINLKAGKPVLWYTNCGWTNPFSHNITAIYLSNAGAKSANVKIRFGYNS